MAHTFNPNTLEQAICCEFKVCIVLGHKGPYLSMNHSENPVPRKSTHGLGIVAHTFILSSWEAYATGRQYL